MLSDAPMLVKQSLVNITNMKKCPSPHSTVTSSQSAPPVPLQTYIWEDIRRQKSRGLYPWTHLYKGPYTGSLTIEL